MAKTNPFSIRLCIETRRALDAFARAENRSVTNAIESLLVEGLKRRRYIIATGKLGSLVAEHEAGETDTDNA